MPRLQVATPFGSSAQPLVSTKVTPAGKRIYILQYRLGQRKAPWRYTIGRHGDYTPDQARNEAKRLRDDEYVSAMAEQIADALRNYRDDQGSFSVGRVR